VFLFGNKKERLMEIEREYLSKINIEECSKEDFSMTVEDIFMIIGKGTVVTGTIQSGICHTDEECILEQPSENINTTILWIDVHTKQRRPNNEAYKSEHVGLLLKGILKEQVEVGGKITIKNAKKD